MKRAVLSLLALSLLALSCYLQSPDPEPTKMPTKPAQVVTRLDLLTPLPTPAIRTYAVVYETVYIRNRDGEVAGYLHQGDLVICGVTDSGWCMMDRGRRVWAGCLEPNEYNLGCEAK